MPYLSALRLVALLGARGAAHAFGDDADFLDTGAFGGVDHVNDFAVAQRARAHDEHRLVLALLEDAAQAIFEFGERDVVVVDRDVLVGGVAEHNLRDVDLGLLGGLGFRRQVDVEPALREGQRGHEDHEEHEEHVDHRRDVHVRVDFELLGGDDPVGSEMVMGVGF